MYDLIGDIHGYADDLEELLRTLGYVKKRGIYRHPERKVVFLGDFIDRGPQIRRVLEIARPMIEEAAAFAVMGNHELNALAYHAEDAEAAGKYLRPRTPNTHRQHRQTLEQLTPAELTDYLDWFRTLPLWLELDGLRAVHACWDPQSMSKIAPAIHGQPTLTNSFLHLACKAGNELFDPIEIVLKGKEATLPEGLFFHDKDGHVRRNTRIRWYLPPGEHTYRTYSLTDDIDCDLPISESVIADASPYPVDVKPVFIGHYWLTAKRPNLLAHNVACLDHSVANGGFLCAYRWQGEQKLTNENFAWVE